MTIHMSPTRALTTTYYVTQEQLDLIEELKQEPFPLNEIYLAIRDGKNFDAIANNLYFEEDYEKAALRYIGGDPTIVFKIKKQLYLLHRIDRKNREVYFSIPNTGNPQHSFYRNDAFTAPLEEIKKWQTPAWEVEKVQHGK